ncbi:NADH dehydrogenase subunit 4 (mitochondrion) [Phlebotomus papatasi]|uniref:NADH-ubiquinone oxidoreductase chain 4 n=9 Tax=Phlebotomus TaxID=13203 RepID=A0A0N9DSR7_PHLPP|nr:NADH dehydrogenase subunit 4 [Phlebotomus papatasi]ALF07256.1 NADH dehydrogenase subunit 4 [Phlebotomus papatasi]
MLKLLLFMLFLMPLCLNKKLYWLVQYLLFFSFFLFMLDSMKSFHWMKLSYYFGVDFLSYGLILLSIWITGLMMMASEKVYLLNKQEKLFMFMLMILLLLLLLTFSTMNIFMFYLFFEGSLIPTLFLVLGWGYQPERLQAGIYLLFYTLLASLPLLLSIFYLYMNFNSLDYFFYNISDMFNVYIYLSLILAFLVKMPMFLVHLWLPKAHVEAPIAGSMILAGVLLKLGGYGLIRMFMIIQYLSVQLNFLLMSISLVGGSLVCFLCLCQTDMKSLIAYSSVVHMGIVIGGILTMTYWGYAGAYGLMIAHGLCSSGMFCLANIVYERSGSRSLLINRGLLTLMPSLTLWWFLMSSMNMAAPPSLNLLSEISLLNSIVMWSWVSMLSLFFISFLGAAYTLYLYAYSQHGKFMIYYGMSVSVVREYLLLFLHWLPLNLLIFKVDYFFLM